MTIIHCVGDVSFQIISYSNIPELQLHFLCVLMCVFDVRCKQRLWIALCYDLISQKCNPGEPTSSRFKAVFVYRNQWASPFMKHISLQCEAKQGNQQLLLSFFPSNAWTHRQEDLGIVISGWPFSTCWTRTRSVTRALTSRNVSRKLRLWWVFICPHQDSS